MRSLELAVILVVVSTAGRDTFRGSALLPHGIYPICWVSGGHRKKRKRASWVIPLGTARSTANVHVSFGSVSGNHIANV